MRQKQPTDKIPDVSDNPVTRPGDIWLLGKHRLLCGDAVNEADVQRLMDCQTADMIFTDPPYNVNYGGQIIDRHRNRKIINDNLSNEDWEMFCKKLFENFKKYNKGDIYMWGASGPNGMKMRLWLVEIGCHWSATIIWSKQHFVLGPAKLIACEQVDRICYGMELDPAYCDVIVRRWEDYTWQKAMRIGCSNETPMATPVKRQQRTLAEVIPID